MCPLRGLCNAQQRQHLRLSCYWILSCGLSSCANQSCGNKYFYVCR